MKLRVIRASYDEETITVYQAYNSGIAAAAVKHQTFVAPFKKERMTWIKPSFLWMMYRAGWGTKENQERVLAVKMKRSGFNDALKTACLTAFDASAHISYDAWHNALKTAPVRVQWDPEKDILLQPLNYKSVQIGLSGEAVRQYLNNWIVEIKDITDYCSCIHQLVKANKLTEATAMLPAETLYPLPADIAIAIHSDQDSGQ
nr:DUF4291 domain-containing protein [uncultured Mucilaginibacter sp.]